MTFDYQSFFEIEGIPYVTSGKNVKKGNVNICCILCGDDTSNHMGCDPATGYWACWRDPTHRGKDPSRLVQIIKGIDAESARKITEDDSLVAHQTFNQLRKRLNKMDEAETKKPMQSLELLKEFRTIVNTGTMAKFWQYLFKPIREGGRGFPESDIRKLCLRYRLLGCNSGQFGQRLILPFYVSTEKVNEFQQYGTKLIGWTARSIQKAEELRYLSYPDGDTIKRSVFNQHIARSGGHTLVVVEGPMDCLKMDFYGARFGIRSVALLGVSATPAQIGVLFGLSKSFARIVVLLDPAAHGPAAYLTQQLAVIKAKQKNLHHLLPFTEKFPNDPGDLSPKQVEEISKQLVKWC